MTWNIWTTAPMTGDRREVVASYSNRGHALAKLRGLQSKALDRHLKDRKPIEHFVLSRDR